MAQGEQQQVEVLLREDNIIVHRWKDETAEWVDGGRGGFRIYKCGATVWLGLVQAGGRNILSNDIVIRGTTQLWSNGATLRINYLNREGATKKVAFCPLRAALNLDEGEDFEKEFEDFVEATTETTPSDASATTEPTAKLATSPNSDSSSNCNNNTTTSTSSTNTSTTNTTSNDSPSNNNTGTTTEPAAVLAVSPSRAASTLSDATPSTKETAPKPDPLAGKERPVFAVEVARILQEHSDLRKVKLNS